MKKTKMNNKTKTLLILAQCLLIAGILLGVTYALDGSPNDPASTHKIPREVRVSRFDLPIGNWQEGETHDAEVFVENLTPPPLQEDLDDDSGAVCVRVSLKEFLQVAATEGEIITDEKTGEPILFATIATGVRAGEYLTVADALSFGLTDYGSYTDPITEVEYATTNIAELRQGVYGKTMNAPGAITKLWGEVSQADARNGPQGHTGECKYTPYLWDGKGITPANAPDDAIRNYIALGGTEEVKLLSKWYEEGGKLGDFWLVDDTIKPGETTADGWVYWGNRLPPGENTNHLLSSLNLEKKPIPATETGVFNYAMHLDMQATDESPEEIVGVFGDVDGVETIEDLALTGKVTDEKLDLLKKLIQGPGFFATFNENAPDGVTVTNMPEINPQFVKQGALLGKPGDPAAQGYGFLFWSTTDKPSSEKVDGVYKDAFDFTKPLAEDVTLHAIWGVKLKFKPKGGDDFDDGAWDDTPNNADDVDFFVAVGTTLTQVQESLNNGENPILNNQSGQMFAFWSTNKTVQAVPFSAEEPIVQTHTFYAHYGFEVTLRAWAKPGDESSTNGNFGVDSKDQPITEITTVIRYGQTMAALPDALLPSYNGEGRQLMDWTKNPYHEDGSLPVEFSDPITQADLILYSMWGVPVVFYARIDDGGHFLAGASRTVINDPETGEPITSYTRIVPENATIGGLGSDDDGNSIFWTKKPTEDPGTRKKTSYMLRFWSEKKDATPADRGTTKEHNFTSRVENPMELYPVYDQINPFSFKLDLSKSGSNDGGSGHTVKLNIDHYEITTMDSLTNPNPPKNSFYIDWGGPGSVSNTSVCEKVEPGNDADYRYHYMGDPNTGAVKGLVGYTYQQTGGSERTISIDGEMPGGIIFNWKLDRDQEGDGEFRLIEVLTPFLPMLDSPGSHPVQTRIIRENGVAGAFLDCKNFETIDEEGDLLANNAHVYNLSINGNGLFDGCSKMNFTQKQLANLCANNVDLKNASSLIYGAGVPELPEMMFARNTKLEDVSYAFGKNRISEIPEKLFANNPLITTFKETFYNCQDLGTIPARLFANNTLVESFEKTFGECYRIQTIPEGLFENNSEVTSFKDLFFYCYWISAIPKDLFKNNTKVTSFERTFYSSQGVRGDVPTLWVSHPHVTAPNSAGCFGGLDSYYVTNYNSIPGAWK